MLYYGMTTNKEINNKYLIAYLVNFLNFIAKYGQITYNLSSSLDFVGLKTLMHNKLSSWIEDAISGADEKGNVTIILDEGTP